MLALLRSFVEAVHGDALWDLTRGALAWGLRRVGLERLAGPSAEEWLREQERFARLGEPVTVIREVRVGSRLVTWNVTEKRGASVNDRELFRAQAHRAGLLVHKAQLLHDAPQDPEDAWYELVYELTLPDNDTRIEGNGEGDLHEAAVLDEVGQRSATACAKLANGERPLRRRLKVP